MRSVIFIGTALAVMALAFWAYSENYATQATLREMRQIQDDIAEKKARLSVLQAEWAYLNRPDRLADLADFNFDRLGLLSLTSKHYGRIDQILYGTPVQETAP